MTHYCLRRPWWRRLFNRLLRRRSSCACHLVSAQPVIVRGSGDETDPYVVEL